MGVQSPASAAPAKAQPSSPRPGGTGASSVPPSEAPAKSSLIPNCTVSSANPDGSAFATVYLRPDIMRRLKNRAQDQDLGEYLWANILQRALDAHCY